MAYSHFYAKFYTVLRRFSRNFSQFIKFPPTIIYLAIIIALQIFNWWQAWNIFRRLTSEFLILHYNVDFGIDLLGQSRDVFYFPTLSLVVVLFNIILALSFFRRPKGRLLMHLLLSATIIFSVFVSTALLMLSLINFR